METVLILISAILWKLIASLGVREGQEQAQKYSLRLQVSAFSSYYLCILSS